MEEEARIILIRVGPTRDPEVCTAARYKVCPPQGDALDVELEEGQRYSLQPLHERTVALRKDCYDPKLIGENEGPGNLRHRAFYPSDEPDLYWTTPSGKEVPVTRIKDIAPLIHTGMPAKLPESFGAHIKLVNTWKRNTVYPNETVLKEGIFS